MRRRIIITAPIASATPSTHATMARAINVVVDALRGAGAGAASSLAGRRESMPNSRCRVCRPCGVRLRAQKLSTVEAFTDGANWKLAVKHVPPHARVGPSPTHWMETGPPKYADSAASMVASDGSAEKLAEKARGTTVAGGRVEVVGAAVVVVAVDEGVGGATVVVALGGLAVVDAG